MSVLLATVEVLLSVPSSLLSVVQLEIWIITFKEEVVQPITAKFSIKTEVPPPAIDVIESQIPTHKLKTVKASLSPRPALILEEEIQSGKPSFRLLSLTIYLLTTISSS